jgi:hypothetical protein
MPKPFPRTACLLLLTVAVALFAGTTRADDPQPLKVWFVGNSYTYVNDLPRMVAELARAGKQRPLEYDRETPGGVTLEKHVKDGRAATKIAAQKWDFVVLQEQSVRPIKDPAAMLQYGKTLDAEVNKQGARTLLYLTWARQDAPETQAALTKAYRELAKETKAIVAPVGLAWEAALKDDPSAGLHAPDKSHPSKKGTYLAACVFHGVLYQKSPEGLPGEIGGLSDEDAVKLQRISARCPAPSSSGTPGSPCEYRLSRDRRSRGRCPGRP